MAQSAKTARKVSDILYRSSYKMEMEMDEYIHLCDSLLLLYPKLTYDICTYRLKAHYDNTYLADAIYDLEAMLLNPAKKSYSRIDITDIRNVLTPISSNFLLAQQYFTSGYYPECVPLLQEIHTKCLFFWQTHAMLFTCLDSMNLHDSAMAAIEIGITHTASPHLYAARVHKAFVQKNYKIALSDANYLIKYGYDDADVFYLRSKIFLEKGQLHEALLDMQSANALSPGNSRYMMHNARLYFYSMEMEVANTLYSNALKRGQVPDSLDAQLCLYTHLKGDNPNSERIRQMIAFYPNNPVLYKVIVETGYGYPDSTLFYLDQAIERFPKESDFYAARSGIKRDKNHNDPQVKKDYYMLIELNPDTIYWHLELYNYVKYRSPKEAKVIEKRARIDMHKLVEKDTSCAMSWFQLGEAYTMNGFYFESPEAQRKANTCYSRCIELDSGYYPAYYQRAQVQVWGKNDLEAYLRDMRKALSLNEFWHYRHAIALQLSYKKRHNEAIEEISRAIELYPDNALLYETRASFYDKINKPDLAEKDRKAGEELKSACENCPPPPPPAIPMH